MNLSESSWRSSLIAGYPVTSTQFYYILLQWSINKCSRFDAEDTYLEHVPNP